MKTSRRDFITAAGSAVIAGTMGRLGAESPEETPPLDIRDIWIGQGFSPDAPDAVLMAVVADTHLSLNPAFPTKWADHVNNALVAELNQLQPQLTHLVFAGDVVMSHNTGTGMKRNGYHYIAARQEMRLFVEQLGRFRSDLDVVAIPGNHDTDSEENLAGGTPELWVEEIQTPPYQKRILAGVAVFFLNSGHNGDLNREQAQWFAAEAAAVPPGQEVLIVAHHPSLYYINVEVGLKRKVTAAFAGHLAPVWIIGGHGHTFAEALYLYRGTRFIQMAVTTANPVQWGDGNHPGYALLGLQDGRVACRIFRKIEEPSYFRPRASLDKLQATPLRWAFDLIEYPAEIFEEGEYDRAGRVVDFLANEVLSYFTYLGFFTVRVNLSRFGGRVREFLVSAAMESSIVPSMSCSFSEHGTSGPWEVVPFPTEHPNNIYRIPIPSQFWSSPQLFVKIATSQERYHANIFLGGWGLAATGALLNGYEKWISAHYHTILPNGQAAPLATPAGSQRTNLVHFAFNIPLPALGPVTQTGSSISGMPAYSQGSGQVIRFRFARRPASSHSSVSYAVEQSNDLIDWATLNEEQLVISPLDSQWEEVSAFLPVVDGTGTYCRARVTSLGMNGGSTSITSGDHNGDGIDDLLQYAFDLDADDGGLRAYDPARVTRKAGIPVQDLQEAKMSRFVYPRLRASSNPGVVYSIQQSQNLSTWLDVPVANLKERVIRSNGEWDEIEATIIDAGTSTLFYRIALVFSETTPA